MMLTHAKVEFVKKKKRFCTHVKRFSVFRNIFPSATHMYEDKLKLKPLTRIFSLDSSTNQHFSPVSRNQHVASSCTSKSFL